MTHIHRLLRPIVMGMVVLALTAGAAFAGRPTGVSLRHDLGAPTVGAGQEAGETDEDGDAEEAPDADAEAGGDHCATDPGAATPEELAALNHGAIVCWAAHQETPEGYRNHGAFVSAWAKKDHASEAAHRGQAGKDKSHKP